MKRQLAAALLLSSALFAPIAHAQSLSADGAGQTLQRLSDQFFDEFWFPHNPSMGTALGLHQYDEKLENFSAAEEKSNVVALQEWEKKIAAIPADGLDAGPRADRELLLNYIRTQILQMDAVRGWEKNPDNYSSGVTNSIFMLMERPFAPANTRLRSAVAREKQIPEALAEARKNLKNPPHIYTEIALQQIDGDVSFFENDVPAAFKDATDKAAQAEFAKSNAAVVEALKSYGVWMKDDLLARSNGDYKWGAETYSRMLASQEMVDTPLGKLLEIGLADLHKNQAEFARVAKQIDPTKTPEQELAELATIHPAPKDLIASFGLTFDSLQSFIRSHHIITLPANTQPVLEETPPFMRATTQASMDPPGAFETGTDKAYFNVTLPDPRWPKAKQDEYMAAFNEGTIVSTSVHEAFPGHYVQFLWQKQFPSRIRKIVMANTNVEGWAHYCEQMMLDEGYGESVAKTPRDAKLIRLGQLQDALLRDARFVVAIRLHTGVGGPMTTGQAVEFFVKEGYQSRPIAEVETKRGTSDALYLYYTLGKLEIMKLREDVRKKQGAAFSLEKFHDQLMLQGMVPIKIARQAMLHDGSPVL
ncbi:MAG: DUF885 domain-containing protein [Acidobacteriaceae bacterium]|nr:DUF885 domain-containing protein [Acidobacteriaceae bacterium]